MVLKKSAYMCVCEIDIEISEKGLIWKAPDGKIFSENGNTFAGPDLTYFTFEISQILRE